MPSPTSHTVSNSRIISGLSAGINNIDLAEVFSLDDINTPWGIWEATCQHRLPFDAVKKIMGRQFAEELEKELEARGDILSYVPERAVLWWSYQVKEPKNYFIFVRTEDKDIASYVRYY